MKMSDRSWGPGLSLFPRVTRAQNTRKQRPRDGCARSNSPLTDRICPQTTDSKTLIEKSWGRYHAGCYFGGLVSPSLLVWAIPCSAWVSPQHMPSGCTWPECVHLLLIQAQQSLVSSPWTSHFLWTLRGQESESSLLLEGPLSSPNPRPHPSSLPENPEPPPLCSQVPVPLARGQDWFSTLSQATLEQPAALSAYTQWDRHQEILLSLPMQLRSGVLLVNFRFDTYMLLCPVMSIAWVVGSKTLNFEKFRFYSLYSYHLGFFKVSLRETFYFLKL